MCVCLLKGPQAWRALPGARQGPQEGSADPAAHPPRRASQERELARHLCPSHGLWLREHQSLRTQCGLSDSGSLVLSTGV